MLKCFIRIFLLKKELHWKDYFGDWHEPINMTENDDKIPYDMLVDNVVGYNYDNSFTILESKKKLGNPSLEQLGSQLCEHCKELDNLRSRISIGYYANSGQNQVGYNEISSEDLQNLEDILLNRVIDKKLGLDFILSSPGGLIEPSLLLSKKIREYTNDLSFLLCGSTYSAAVLMSFSGDEIIMQSFAHLAPINPKINGFDTYIGKQIYRTHYWHKILCPWAANSLPEAKIAENNVTMKTLTSAEKTVYEAATYGLYKHLFKAHKLPIIQKIKAIVKIRKIVNFFFKFENHHTHNMPFFSKEVLSAGLPIKQADEQLDTILRKIRNICDEITSTKFVNEDGSSYYVRKVYFSRANWLILKVQS